MCRVHPRRPRARHLPTSIAWRACARRAVASVPCRQRYCWWLSRHGYRCEDGRGRLNRQRPCWVRRRGDPRCLRGRIHCNHVSPSVRRLLRMRITYPAVNISIRCCSVVPGSSLFLNPEKMPSCFNKALPAARLTSIISCCSMSFRGGMQ